jgi:hypothetical protein
MKVGGAKMAFWRQNWSNKQEENGTNKSHQWKNKKLGNVMYCT